MSQSVRSQPASGSYVLPYMPDLMPSPYPYGLSYAIYVGTAGLLHNCCRIPCILIPWKHHRTWEFDAVMSAVCALPFTGMHLIKSGHGTVSCSVRWFANWACRTCRHGDPFPSMCVYGIGMHVWCFCPAPVCICNARAPCRRDKEYGIKESSHIRCIHVRSRLHAKARNFTCRGGRGAGQSLLYSRGGRHKRHNDCHVMHAGHDIARASGNITYRDMFRTDRTAVVVYTAYFIILNGIMCIFIIYGDESQVMFTAYLRVVSVPYMVMHHQAVCRAQ